MLYRARGYSSKVFMEFTKGSYRNTLYHLFKDAPARLEDYVSVTDGQKPLKFVSHRWLENLPVVQRAISILPNIKDYIEAVEQKKVTKPGTNSYEIIAECMKDPCFLAKLHFFKLLASQLQPFLKQTNLCYPLRLVRYTNFLEA